MKNTFCKEKPSNLNNFQFGIMIGAGQNWPKSKKRS
jgi:hypothetical protein